MKKYAAFLDHNNKRQRVDRAIKSVLVHLQKHGLKTIMSCAGHRKNGWLAFITFLPNEEFEKYVNESPWELKIVNCYGITVVVRSQYRVSPEGYTKETRKQFIKWLAMWRREP